MNNFKNDLKLLFDSLESSEILLALKENFIFMVNSNISFDEEYKEIYKEIYFEKLKNHISILNQCMEKQRKISELKLTELHNIIDYEKMENILYTLEWSIEYINNNYIEMDLQNEIIIRPNTDDTLKLDLNKLCCFLKNYSCN